MRTTDDLHLDAIPVANERAVARDQLVIWRIGAVMLLGGLMLMAFAVSSIAVGQTRSAVIEVTIAGCLIIGAAIIARQRKRSTRLDLG